MSRNGTRPCEADAGRNESISTTPSAHSSPPNKCASSSWDTSRRAGVSACAATRRCKRAERGTGGWSPASGEGGRSRPTPSLVSSCARRLRKSIPVTPCVQQRDRERVARRFLGNESPLHPWPESAPRTPDNPTGTRTPPPGLAHPRSLHRGGRRAEPTNRYHPDSCHKGRG